MKPSWACISLGPRDAVLQANCKTLVPTRARKHPICIKSYLRGSPKSLRPDLPLTGAPGAGILEIYKSSRFISPGLGQAANQKLEAFVGLLLFWASRCSPPGELQNFGSDPGPKASDLYQILFAGKPKIIPSWPTPCQALAWARLLIRILKLSWACISLGPRAAILQTNCKILVPTP